MSNQRSFLFLQGMATQFFAKLGAALAKKGHDVHRINFNGGDKLFWMRSGAVDLSLIRQCDHGSVRLNVTHVALIKPRSDAAKRSR